MPELLDNVTLRPAPDVHNELQRRDCLARKSTGRQPREHPERFETGRHVFNAVRVQRARSSVMPGVECGKHRRDLSPSTFAQHDAIGAHAQRLPEQPLKRYLADLFDI